ncbi:type III-A CRISPR-associated CARF protein Csm6 [Peptacetobacter sp.]|uniref:type III-A CRISPR-associated CARF protein Csm6 n=1 Tax=Peptacetobacter sp. TaxID=2991975 RepID=UPI00260FAF80|nr:hypothetical protein [Peptacetobacter sp.]
MRILFSPIGLTDPISKMHDGAMLHITRVYSPEVVYLYFSEEMREKQNKDQRYTKVIELLDKKIGKNTKIEIIDGSKIEAVYKFDSYYEEFESNLKKIREKYPDSEIFLNTSSGTPAMKSALQVIAALGDGNYKAIQVPAPNKINHEPPEIPFEKLWRENKDNFDGYKDRTEVSTHLQLITKFKKEIIKKHIDQYDYHAALELAKDIKRSLSKEALYAIEAAKERLSLNYMSYAKLLKKSGADIEYFKLKKYKNNNEDIKLYEYILSLEIKVKREEYADFIRGISPILSDIFKLYLERKLEINILKYCSGSDSKLKIKDSKLKNEISKNNKEAQIILNSLNEEFGKFRDSLLAASNLSAIIKGVETNEKVKNTIITLRQVEENVRNIAAHQVVSINDEKIKEGTSDSITIQNGKLIKKGKSSKDIIDMIKFIAQEAEISNEDEWNSYEKMNKYIKSLI